MLVLILAVVVGASVLNLRAEDWRRVDEAVVYTTRDGATGVLRGEAFATCTNFQGDDSCGFICDTLWEYCEVFERGSFALNQIDFCQRMDSFDVIANHLSFPSTILALWGPKENQTTPLIGPEEGNRPYCPHDYWTIITLQFGAHIGRSRWLRPFYHSGEFVYWNQRFPHDLRYYVRHWQVLPFFDWYDTLRVDQSFYPDCKFSVWSIGHHEFNSPGFESFPHIRPDSVAFDGTFYYTLHPDSGVPMQCAGVVTDVASGELLTVPALRGVDPEILVLPPEISTQADVLRYQCADSTRFFVLDTWEIFDAPYRAPRRQP